MWMSRPTPRHPPRAGRARLQSCRLCAAQVENGFSRCGTLQETAIRRYFRIADHPFRIGDWLQAISSKPVYGQLPGPLTAVCERHRPLPFTIWVGKRAFGSFVPDSDYPLIGLLPRNAPIGVSRPLRRLSGRIQPRLRIASFQDDGIDCTLKGYQVYRAESARLGNDSVDAVAAGQIRASEEKLEVLPSAEAYDHRIRNIPRSSRVPVGQQLRALVHRVDAVVAGQIFAREEELESLPSTEADDHRVRNIPRGSGVTVRQQLSALVDRINSAAAGNIFAAEQKLEVF